VSTSSRRHHRWQRNGYDGVLDKLKTAMDTAGVTLAELTTAVSTTSGAAAIPAPRSSTPYWRPRPVVPD
jgi:hypothetical protein